MRGIGVAPRKLAVLGILAGLGVAGCSAIATSQPVAAVLNQPTARLASGPASSPAAKPSASASGGAIQDLVVSAAVRGELTGAFAVVHDIPQSYVTGTQPGSVYYAYVPATHTYWAMARFDVSATAVQKYPAGFQDGGDIGEFKKVGTGGWQGVLGGIPVYCGEAAFFPKAVLAAWSLPTSPPAGMNC